MFSFDKRKSGRMILGVSMSGSSPEYNVTALRKSIAVLGVVKDSDIPLGVSEIARRADVSKNMCLRILETLTDVGWVLQHPSGPVYELSLAPFQFFAGSRNRMTLMDQALPPLRKLNRETGESVYLTVLHQDRALMIHVIKGTQPISVTGEIGASYDLHATAPGKVFLAWAEPDFLKRFLKGKLKTYTDGTLTAPKTLRAELERVRAQGYAVNKEEYGPGLLGLAAPVFDEDGSVVASIGIFAPSTNISPESFESTWVEAVLAAARAVTSGGA